MNSGDHVPVPDSNKGRGRVLHVQRHGQGKHENQENKARPNMMNRSLSQHGYGEWFGDFVCVGVSEINALRNPLDI